jgi:sorting nexin-25
MALSRRHVILAGISGFISWGFIVSWLPFARYLGYAFITGASVVSITLLSVVLLTVNTDTDNARGRRVGPTMAFLAPENWTKEVENHRKNAIYEPSALYPQSFVVSESIDELLHLASRDFISSWYVNISKSPVFVHEIDKALRVALGNLRDRILSEDVVSLVVSRIVPIVTAHLKEFDRAERAVRGKNLSRTVTESEELDLAIASKYRDGRLHPAVAVSFSDQKTLQQEYVRKLVMGLLPQLLSPGLLNSRVVSVLIREIVACAVLYPVVTLLSDPDTWNQLIETYGRNTLQDRKTVRKLREALDEHASPVSKSKQAQVFPRLGPNDSERAFERFVRAIRRCNNISDARRFRSQVASQFKRESMVEGQDQVYLRRLETGKRVLDQKVARLASAGSAGHLAPVKFNVQRGSAPKSREIALEELMHDVSGLSYFMEFMDRQHRMPLVQFWIVVDGFRNPLEDDFGDDTASINWTATDVNDMALINETCFSKPELKVPEESRQAVKAFLSAGKNATPEQYRKARTAILTTQSAVLEKLENKYYPKFKQSDIYYKYISSDESSATTAQQAVPPRALTPAPETTERRPLPPLMTRTQSQPSLLKARDLRRAAVSSEVRSGSKLFDDDESPRHSLDSERSVPLFDDDDYDDDDTDALGMSTHSLGQSSQNGDGDSRNNQVIRSMEAALNDIITNEPTNDKFDDLKSSAVVSPSSLSSDDKDNKSPRSSLDVPRIDARITERAKPSISSLGLITPSSRTGVFEDELFPDEKKFIEDEFADPEGDDKDPADEIHEAAPGDLGLAEAIAALTEDIEKLGSQESVLDALTRKAELTNNTAELRILGKSKASIQREIRRKEMQRQQYVIQESDNSLYGRSTIQIKSIMVGKEEDGREFAICKRS